MTKTADQIRKGDTVTLDRGTRRVLRTTHTGEFVELIITGFDGHVWIRADTEITATR